MTRQDVRQQNAERRLSHARWERAARREWPFLVYGALAAITVLLLFSVRS